MCSLALIYAYESDIKELRAEPIHLPFYCTRFMPVDTLDLVYYCYYLFSYLRESLIYKVQIPSMCYSSGITSKVLQHVCNY
jgi:hypothetical protein